ncbi:hypothetical protein BSKO_06779 [Bryopsis sp. KO-2023]|nr:hypothetical protein BSKO_06779 [Bryopsis sp. KO-2023]
MESIRKTPENVERRFGEALGARDSALALLGKRPGLGPPDLCWVQKRVKKVFRKNFEVRGYYHWVLGLDVASETSASSYFASLNAAVEKPGFLQGLVPREYNIERGIYCCHDPFNCVDIWCDLQSEGKIMARAIDTKGYICDVTPTMWWGVRLGSFLRAELYDSAATMSSIRFIRRLDLFSTHDEESSFLDAVLRLYKVGLVQECLERLQWDKGEGVLAEDRDIVSNTILHYFRKGRRWQKALQFFTQLQEVYPPAAVYLAAIYRELDNAEGATAVLGGCVDDLGHKEVPILIAFGSQLLESGETRRAIEMAKKSIGKAQTCRPAWVLLLGCFAKSGDYGMSLKLMNLMPGPVMPPHDKDLLFHVLPQSPKSMTKPYTVQYSPEVTELRKMSYETQLSSRQVGRLPAQILAPEMYGNSSVLANSSPTHCTQAVARKSYRILLNIVREVGWEAFMALRSKLFTFPDSALHIRTSSSIASKPPASIQDAPSEAATVRLVVESIDGQEEHVSVIVEVVHDGDPDGKVEAVQSEPQESSDAVDKTQLESSPSADVDAKEILTKEEGAATPEEQGGGEQKNEEEEGSTAEETKEVASTSSQNEQISESLTATNSLPPPLQDGQVPKAEKLRRAKFPKAALESSEFVEKRLARKMAMEELDVEARVPSQTASTSEEPLSKPSELKSQNGGMPPLPSPRITGSFANRPSPRPPGSYAGSEAGSQNEKDPDRWLVREVSRGIKDRVRYFESMSVKKQEDESFNKSAVDQEEATVEPKLKPVSSRKGTSMSMMDFLTTGFDKAPLSEAASVTPSGTDPDSDEHDETCVEEKPVGEGATGTPSRLAVKGGWSSVDWGSMKERPSSDIEESPSTGGRQEDYDSRPMSPFMAEAMMGRELEDKDVPTDTHADGTWIVEVLGELQECDCSEWLDELILALWEDLAIYTELRKIDRQWKAKTGKTQAELILGTEEEDYASGNDDQNAEVQERSSDSSVAQSIPKSTSGDWMRRGMLCERLERIPEAEQAYRVCIFKGFNLTALLGLSRIYAAWGWCKETMQVLNRVAEYHDRCHDFQKDPYTPQSIVRAISQLVPCVGNMEVRSCATNCHPMVKHVVESVLKWQLRSGQERRGSVNVVEKDSTVS